MAGAVTMRPREIHELAAADICDPVQISETKMANRLVIGLTGRLDSATSPLLDVRLGALIEGGETQIVFDCTQLHYLSSAGLRVLLVGAKKLSGRGGRIVLAAAKSHVLEVVHLGGFESIFPHFSTIEAAIAV